jgi:diguanylate cyclase (GGDEF)-like protein
VEIVATYSPLNSGRLYVFSKDLTERKRAEERSWHQANFDSLTNLPNRALLFDRLAQECAVARRNNASVAVMFADLDGFKQVNDRHGHAAGDWVLQEVARRWLACVREVDTVARLGGDEFAIVVGGLVDTSAVGAMAEKLIDALRTDFVLPQGPRCRVGVSIGICFYPGDATAIDSLVSLADAAMYASKSRGRNTFTFRSDMHASPDS